MAESRFADLSCHIEPTGVISFSVTSVSSDDDTVTASATTDTRGNIVKGSWSHDDKEGTELSVSFPDGAIGGRNAPKKPEDAEGLREARGDFLMRKVDDLRKSGDCRKLKSLSFF